MSTTQPDDRRNDIVPGRCSVIIPAFNVAAYVSEAIESAIGQTYPDVEVVVVDDGSTDGTGEILDSFEGRAVVLHQRNRGASAARNRGIRASSGSFLAFLDADDRWAPERLERCIELLERESADAVTTDAILFDDSGRELGRYYDGVPRNGFTAENQAAVLFAGNFVFGAAVLRRSVLPAGPVFDETLMSSIDYELWLRLAAHGVRFHLVDEPFAGYRIRPGSWSQHPDAYKFHLRALARTAGMLADRLEPPWAARTYAAADVVLADGERSLALDLLQLSARDPSLRRSERLRIRAVALATALRLRRC